VGVVGGGVGLGGEMTQALYAHMNNKTIKKRKKRMKSILSWKHSSKIDHFPPCDVLNFNTHTAKMN
jgi:hypothetical protein